MATTYTMPQGTYIPPKLNERRFTCPLCHTLTPQRWSAFKDPDHNLIYVNKHQVWSSQCFTCKDACLWVGEKMIYPDTGNAPLPNGDLPEKALVNYKEAADIFPRSHRAAAAMLRLAVQDICVHLGGEGKNMQADIDYLIKEKGLSARLVKSMDAVRIVGNEAIHPGEMDLQDDDKTVGTLFGIVNHIAEKLITEPRVEDKFYDDLPDSKKRKNIPKE